GDAGAIRVGISSKGSLDDIQIGNLEDETGAKFRRVVSGSGGDVVTQLLGGSVDAGVLNPGEVIGQLEAGKLKALAVFSSDRLEGKELEDVPTAKEQGADVTIGQWRGVLAPPGITKAQTQYWI